MLRERSGRCRAPPSRPPGRMWGDPGGRAPTGSPRRPGRRLVSSEHPSVSGWLFRKSFGDRADVGATQPQVRKCKMLCKFEKLTAQPTWKRDKIRRVSTQISSWQPIILVGCSPVYRNGFEGFVRAIFGDLGRPGADLPGKLCNGGVWLIVKCLLSSCSFSVWKVTVLNETFFFCFAFYKLGRRNCIEINSNTINSWLISHILYYFIYKQKTIFKCHVGSYI